MSSANAYLVSYFDGHQTYVTVPPEMGEPREDQLIGTPSEVLCELAGRTCYDSLGRGRDSEAYHRHILEVGHLSVYEHAQFSFASPPSLRDTFLNRPGTWVLPKAAHDLITMNLRAVLDWDAWTEIQGPLDRSHYPAAFTLVLEHAAGIAPNLIRLAFPQRDPVAPKISGIECDHPEFRWATMLITCSRNCSHELIRHRFRTAVSQRSTRYVDESESDFVAHPASVLINPLRPEPASLLDDAPELVALTRGHYKACVERVSASLENRGVGRHNAIKQARGFARSYLGTSLETQVMFSASYGQWSRILAQRLHNAADAEIRRVAACALRELQRIGSANFGRFGVVDAADGMGVVLA